MKEYVVIAGNHAQFMYWCRQNDVYPPNCIYVDNRFKLLGLRPRDLTLVLTGTYYERADYYRDLYEELQLIERIEPFREIRS